MSLKKYLLVLLFFIPATPGLAFNGNVGDTLQKIVLNTPNGKKFDSSVLSGKHPLMMVFWATWCLSCIREIPDLKKIHAKYEPKGLKMVAVNISIRDTTDMINEFVEDNSIPYPVAIDQDSVITKGFGIKHIPTVIITDKKGIIKYRSHHLPKDFSHLYNELVK